MAMDDPSIARRMLDSPEIADGISAEELAAFTGSHSYFLERIEEEYPAIWEIISDYEWISGDASGMRRHTPSGLLASPLPSHGLTALDQWALAVIRRITNVDAVLGERLVSLPWIADGISLDERWALLRFLYIAERSPSLAGQFLELAWFADGISEFELKALVVCWLLTGNDTGQTQLLLSQPWFRDQLNDEEVALVVTLRSGCRWNPFYRELVEDGQVEFEIFARPSGQVKLFVVSRTPLGPQTDTVFQGIRTGIEAIENFMGPPWVKTDVVVYLEPGIRYIREVSGLNYGSHILIQPDPSTPYFKDVLYHELAHFYFGYGNAPRWLAEGGANFLESYTIHVSEDASMQSRYDLAQQSMLRRCLPQGISKVNELLEATAFLTPGVYLTSSLWPCTYPVGESFLLGIYIAFGHDVVSSSMRSLYKRGLTSYSPASEDEIVWTVPFAYSVCPLTASPALTLVAPDSVPYLRQWV